MKTNFILPTSIIQSAYRTISREPRTSQNINSMKNKTDSELNLQNAREIKGARTRALAEPSVCYIKMRARGHYHYGGGGERLNDSPQFFSTAENHREKMSPVSAFSLAARTPGFN